MGYNLTSSTIVCQFMNQTDRSVKTCTVLYGQCDQMLAYAYQGNSTVDTPNYIALNVDASYFECYVVTASSDTVTVVVEGQRRMTAGIKFNNKISL